MSLDRVNHINSGLIVIAAALAYIFPFELVVFSYAYLGPAHYLTEISWLHDRKYFTTGKRDFWWLIALTIPITFAATESFAAACLWLAFSSAFAMAIIHDQARKGALILALALLGLFLGGFEIKHYFYVFVPTLIHVFLFTGAFILVGGLKSKSVSAYISLIFFVAAPVLLLMTPPASALGSAIPSDKLPFLQLLHDEMAVIGALIGTESYSERIMAFISFAYTYHYLNWFSKTKVIGWHEISRKRAAVIVAGYLIAIGIYLWNYSMGYLVLLFLSMLHVILEFPLNHKSFVMIGEELRARVSTRASGSSA